MNQVLRVLTRGAGLPSEARVDIPLLAQLIPDGIRAGATLMVEFDPASQWFAVAVTIAKKMIERGGYVSFNVMGRPPEAIENELSTLGLDVPRAFKEGKLEINDWYSATLTGGRIEPLTPGSNVIAKSPKGFKFLSVKVQDLSVEFLKDAKFTITTGWGAGTLIIVDSYSMFLRFNEEKPFCEFLETRAISNARKMGRIVLMGLVTGLHSDWLYKRLESVSDGVIDIRSRERDEKVRAFLRVRSLRGQPHDSAWHEIEIKPNGEAVLKS